MNKTHIKNLKFEIIDFIDTNFNYFQISIK